MVGKVDTALVHIWDQDVGAISWLDDRGYAVFEFDPAFVKSGPDLAPLQMGLGDARRGQTTFQFPGLNRDSFSGLPGLLADALPDKFGNAIIDAWLARIGRDAGSFSPVERLCYMGRRGMGALEFEPAASGRFTASTPIDVANLVELAQEVMQQRGNLNSHIDDGNEAIMAMLRVGTSAGGARPKAIVAINPAGNIISGQGAVPEGYEHWILKFDGVTDLELGKPQEFGRVEYAYHLMAQEAGIEMSECRLLEEHGRAHFMTRRFDRLEGRKLHMQSLCGIAHYDFNMAGAYGYEQAFMVMRKLGLSKAEALQQYRRMLFNVVARNQDDHTKNIAFLMDRNGQWKLSPAYDVTYSHNPAGKWTNQHQMSINGKRDHFTRDDLLTIGRSIRLPNPEAVLDEIIEAVRQWPEFAKQAGVSSSRIDEISKAHRLGL